MELLERYLQAVKKHLPWERQDDILAELRANLESQLEDREAELGRPLTEAEVGAWLKEVGPPIAVAGKYQPRQFLIGPAVFPIYWYVLRLALTWALVINVVANAALLLTGRDVTGGAVASAILRTPGVLLTAAAWVTLVFAVLEWSANCYPEKLPAFAGLTADWSPGSLPVVSAETVRGKRPRTFARAVAEVVFGALVLVWLLLIPHNPWLLMGPGYAALEASPFAIAPVWIVFYWWIVGLNVVQLGWRLVDVLRGTWGARREWQDAVVKVIGLIPVCLLLAVKGHTLVSLKDPVLDAAQHGVTVAAVNRAFSFGFSVIVVTSVV